MPRPISEGQDNIDGKRKADEEPEEDDEDELGDDDDDLGYDDDEPRDRDHDRDEPAPFDDSDDRDEESARPPSSPPRPAASRRVRPKIPRIVTALRAALESSDPGPAEASLVALINRPHGGSKRERPGDEGGSSAERESAPAIVTAVEAIEADICRAEDLEIINRLNKPFEEVEYGVLYLKRGAKKKHKARATKGKAKAATKAAKPSKETKAAAKTAPGPYEQWLLDQKNKPAAPTTDPPPKPKKPSAIEPTKPPASVQARAILKTSRLIDRQIQTAATKKTGHPPVTSAVLAKLEREEARKLLEPYFSEELRRNLFKFSRAGLAELVERKLADGSIAPKTFWRVAKQSEADDRASTVRGASANAEAEFPPRSASNPATVPTPIAPPPGAIAPRGRPPVPPPAHGPCAPPRTGYRPLGAPFPSPADSYAAWRRRSLEPPERPPRKYALRPPAETRSAEKRPTGVLVSDAPSSPSPRCPVSGTFYSGGLVSTVSDGTVVGDNVGEQLRFVFGNLRSMLRWMDASLGDILTMTIWVKDLRSNGEDVKEEKERFLGSDALVKIVGVESLMPKGALVMVEVSVVVRAAHPSRFELQRA